MTNGPIPVKQANAMVSEYIAYMTKLGVDMNNQTQSVGFTSPELVKWMSDTLPLADEFRIFFGVYPPGHEQAGRLTSIIWPYKNGNPSVEPLVSGSLGDDGTPVKPYNDGSGAP